MVKFFHKHWACTEIALRQQLAQRGQLTGRFFLYIIIVYVFHQVFQSVQGGHARTWYLAITEWLILSSSPIAIQISDDVRTGQISYFLLRPIQYLSLRFCECLGVFSIRFVLLGILCLALGCSLTGVFPCDPVTWIIGSLMGLLGILLYSFISILMGLSAFWIREIQPVLYLNLTATFCFGGLIVPLDFYSSIFQKISFFTPYPWILWGPAHYITGNLSSTHLFTMLLGWSFWMLILGTAIGFIYRRCLKSFVLEGG